MINKENRIENHKAPTWLLLKHTFTTKTGKRKRRRKRSWLKNGIVQFITLLTSWLYAKLIHTKTIFYEITIIIILSRENLVPQRLSNLLIFSRAHNELETKSEFRSNLSSSRAQVFTIKIRKEQKKIPYIWKAIKKRVKRRKYFQLLKIFKIKALIETLQLHVW